MKYVSLLLLSLHLGLIADEPKKKWIPIQPIIQNEPKPDINSSKPSQKLTQNLQAIKTLLEHADNHRINNEKSKSWYSFEAAEE